MAQRDREEAIAQMLLASRGLDAAIDKLGKAVPSAVTTQKRRIFKLITELQERLAMTNTFVRHLQAAEVKVQPPKASSFKALEQALTALQKIDVQTAGVAKLLAVAAAVGDASMTTRTEVSERAT